MQIYLYFADTRKPSLTFLSPESCLYLWTSLSSQDEEQRESNPVLGTTHAAKAFLSGSKRAAYCPWKLKPSNQIKHYLSRLRGTGSSRVGRSCPPAGLRAATGPWGAPGALQHPQEPGQGWDNLPPVICAPIPEPGRGERGSMRDRHPDCRQEFTASGCIGAEFGWECFHSSCVPVIGLSAGCSRALVWVSGYYIPLFYLQFNLLLLRTGFLSPPTSTPLPKPRSQRASTLP